MRITEQLRRAIVHDAPSVVATALCRRVRFLVCVFIFTGCATPTYVTHWRQMQLGMSRDAVRQLLGEPHASSAPLDVKATASIKMEGTNVPPELVERGVQFIVGALFDRNYERWIYGEDTFLGPPSKAFAVYFDDQGKVIGYRRPTQGRFRNLSTEDKPPAANSTEH